METVLLQINNFKAYKLLEDLEDLKLIKVLSKDTQKSEKLSDKYRGSIPEDVANEMQKFVDEGRQEWQQRNI